jgi:hypothetical protein
MRQAVANENFKPRHFRFEEDTDGPFCPEVGGESFQRPDERDWGSTISARQRHPEHELQ